MIKTTIISLVATTAILVVIHLATHTTTHKQVVDPSSLKQVKILLPTTSVFFDLETKTNTSGKLRGQ